MEIKRNNDGTFFAYNIPTRGGIETLYAYYDKDGNLVECRAFNPIGKPYTPDSVDLERCRVIGTQYSVVRGDFDSLSNEEIASGLEHWHDAVDSDELRDFLACAAKRVRKLSKAITNNGEI